MTAPNVNQLPTSPARLSRPSNFVTESTIFLEALPTFRTQVNQLNTYLNSNIINKYNFGTIGGVRDFPSISQTALYGIEYDGDSVTFTSELDTLYLTIQQHSTQLTSVGDWYDRIINECGTAPYDLDKPIISGTSTPMVRNQSREDFNTTAVTFHETCVDGINSLYQSMWYTYITSCSNEDFGSVTDTTVIYILDGGSVADTELTY